MGKETVIKEKTEKTFPLRIPFVLHDKARRHAGSEAMSLHAWILRAVEKEIAGSMSILERNSIEGGK